MRQFTIAEIDRRIKVRKNLIAQVEQSAEEKFSERLDVMQGKVAEL